MSHTCHATACNAPCRPEHLMCRTHWALVSPRTKDAVCSYYRPGQCRDKQPSREWIEAALLAVAEVAQKCGMPMSQRHRELLSAAPSEGSAPPPAPIYVRAALTAALSQPSELSKSQVKRIALERGESPGLADSGEVGNG